MLSPQRLELTEAHLLAIADKVVQKLTAAKAVPKCQGEGSGLISWVTPLRVWFVGLVSGVVFMMDELSSQAGKGALLAKLDNQSANRNVPVHADDRYLLGVKLK